jgi:hypothetical protein
MARFSSSQLGGGVISNGYINPRWSVLQYILVLWMQWTEQLEENSLSTKQQKDFLGITILISKMIS